MKKMTAILSLILISLTGTQSFADDSILHGIGYCNAGQTEVSYLKVYYGNFEQPRGAALTNFTGGLDPNCNGGADLVADMPIPENMDVEWQTVNGPRQKITVPIRSLVTDDLTSGKKNIRIRVKIADEKLQVLLNAKDKDTFEESRTVIFEQ